MLHGDKDSREIHVLRFFSRNPRDHPHDDCTRTFGKYGKWKNIPVRGDRVEGKRLALATKYSNSSQEPLHSFPQTMNWRVTIDDITLTVDVPRRINARVASRQTLERTCEGLVPVARHALAEFTRQHREHTFPERGEAKGESEFHGWGQLTIIAQYTRFYVAPRSVHFFDFVTTIDLLFSELRLCRGTLVQVASLTSLWSVSVDRDAEDRPERWTEQGGWHDSCTYTVLSDSVASFSLFFFE